MAIFIAHYITALNLVWLLEHFQAALKDGKKKENQPPPMNPSVNIASYKPKQQDDPTLEIPPGRLEKAKLNISDYQGKPSSL